MEDYWVPTPTSCIRLIKAQTISWCWLCKKPPANECHGEAMDWTHWWEMDQWGLAGKLFMCILLLSNVYYIMLSTD